MTEKAQGSTYEAMIAKGWTDAMMIDQGFMLPPAAASSLPAPDTAFTQVAPMPTPTAAAVHQMTAKAAGATYEAMIAKGWTDAMMIEQGFMLP